MKAKFVLFTVLCLICTMLVSATPAQATVPSELIITADMWANPDGVSASGTFSASGVILENNMPAYEVYFIDFEGGTIHGIKTLYGEHGTITIKYQAVLTFNPDGSGVATGRFTIISGTGDYQELHGNGMTLATIDTFGHILAIYSGVGHID